VIAVALQKSSRYVLGDGQKHEKVKYLLRATAEIQLQGRNQRSRNWMVKWDNREVEGEVGDEAGKQTWLAGGRSLGAATSVAA